MSHFTQLFDQSIAEAESFTSQDELELLEHILEHSAHTDLDSFVIDSISYDDAFNHCASSDDFIPDCVDHLEQNCVNVLPNPDSANSFAYTLAYENPEFGAKLLSELKYYESQGRFA